jgi:hypothetical protein
MKNKKELWNQTGVPVDTEAFSLSIHIITSISEAVFSSVDLQDFGDCPALK